MLKIGPIITLCFISLNASAEPNPDQLYPYPTNPLVSAAQGQPYPYSTLPNQVYPNSQQPQDYYPYGQQSTQIYYNQPARENSTSCGCRMNFK